MPGATITRLGMAGRVGLGSFRSGDIVSLTINGPTSVQFDMFLTFAQTPCGAWTFAGPGTFRQTLGGNVLGCTPNLGDPCTLTAFAQNGSVPVWVTANIGYSEMAQLEPEPFRFFDVRTCIPWSETDDIMLQTAYDRINRTLVLAGDFPFSALYDAPLNSLRRELGRGAKRLRKTSLLQEEAQASLDHLHEHSGSSCLSQILLSNDNGLRQHSDALSEHFFVFPTPTIDSEVRHRQVEALRRLIKVAPWLTPFDIFWKSRKWASPELLAALKDVRSTGALSLPNDDRCCSAGTISDSCNKADDKSCSIIPSSGSCGLYSDQC